MPIKPLDKFRLFAAGFLKIILFACLLVYIIFTLHRNIYGLDYFFHIKSGEYIVQQKVIPRQDVFSFTLKGRPWLNHEWLYQVVVYFIHHCCGTEGFVYFRMACYLAVFILLYIFLNNRLPWFVSWGLLFLGLQVLSGRMVFRPGQVSLFFYVIYLLIIFSRREKAVWLIPFLYLFWVNMHGFAFLGAGIVWLYAVCRLADAKIFGQKPGSFDKKIIWAALALIPLSFLTPYGVKTVIYPLKIVAGVFSGAGSYLKQNITELKSPLSCWHMAAVQSAVWLSGITLLSLILRRKKSFFPYLIYILITAVSFFSLRGLFFCAPLYLILITVNWKWLWENGFLMIFSRLGVKIAVVVLVVFYGFTCASFLKEIQFLSSHGQGYFDYKGHYKLAGFFHKRIPQDTPQDLLRFIKSAHLPGNMFNTFNLGAMLIYNFYPQRKVFIDGRADFYGKKFFETYLDILDAKPSKIKDAVEKYKLKGFIIDFSASVPKLVNYLYKKGYACVYFSQDGIIFLRDTPQNRQYIARYKINLASMQTKRFFLDEIGLNRAPVNRFVKMARVYYDCGLYKQALKMAGEILKIAPLSAGANYITSAVYYNLREYEKSFIFARRSIMADPMQKSAYKLLAKIYLNYYHNREKAKDVLKHLKIKDIAKEIKALNKGDEQDG